MVCVYEGIVIYADDAHSRTSTPTDFVNKPLLFFIV